MKVLIVYYSRTGHTRTLAHRIGDATQAAVEEIVPLAGRRGLLGYVRSALEARFSRCAAIAPPAHDPDRFDVVVIGTPVWAESLSSPVRTYLREHAAVLHRIAFFCTMAQRDSEQVFVQMQRCCARVPLAALALTERELADVGVSPSVDNALNAFIATLGGRHNLRPRDEFGFFEPWGTSAP